MLRFPEYRWRTVGSSFTPSSSSLLTKSIPHSLHHFHCLTPFSASHFFALQSAISHSQSKLHPDFDFTTYTHSFQLPIEKHSLILTLGAKSSKHPLPTPTALYPSRVAQISFHFLSSVLDHSISSWLRYISLSFIDFNVIYWSNLHRNASESVKHDYGRDLHNLRQLLHRSVYYKVSIMINSFQLWIHQRIVTWISRCVQIVICWICVHFRFLKPMVDGTSEQILVDLPSINKCFTFGGQKKLTANNK